MDSSERLVQLIGDKIGHHRGAKAELSRRLGEKDDHWVSDRITKKTAIKADELPRIAAALGVSPCAFFEERPATAPERVYAAVLTVLREEGVIPPESAPTERQPAQEQADRVLRRFLLKALKKEIESGRVGPKGRQTVGEFVSEWLESTVKPRRRPNTYRTYASLVRHHIIPEFGRTRLSEITPQDVQRFTGRLLATHSPRTVHLVRAVLGIALRQAERFDLVARNAARLSDPIPQVETERHPLAPEELPRFLDAARSHRLEALFAVSIGAGLRIGEVLGLSWSDLDVPQGTLAVRQQLDLIDHRYILTEPKRKASKRVLYLPPFAVEVLKHHRVRQVEERLRAGEAWQPSDLVFTTTVGGPVDEDAPRRALAEVCRAAGLSRRVWHDLRRTYATLLNAAKTDLRTMQELMGHASPLMTIGVYTESTEAAKRAAAAGIDRFARPSV